MQHYLACDQVYLHNIDIFNHSNKNNDMIDIDDCHDVIISDVRGDSDDDGITLKSTSGRGVQNVAITNCLLSSHCNAIKCGTESTAGFRNIVISNCVIRPSEKKTVIYGKPAGISGISLETVDGGTIDGISISNIIITGPEVPLFVRLGDRARKFKPDQPEPATGTIRNITLSNITAYEAGPTGSSFTGLPGHPVINLSLSNIRLYYAGGGSAEDASREIPEKEKKYPEATMFGKLNACGMYFRHVENLNIDNVECYTATTDSRPLFWLEDVKGADITETGGDAPAGGPMIKLMESKDIYLNNIKPASPCTLLLEISGKTTENVRIANTSLTKAQKAFIVSGGAAKSEIKLLNNFE
jgi:polygalacturonase